MSIIVQCIKDIKEQLYIAKTDLIIDPCAGCMNFVNAIQHLSATSLFYSSDQDTNNVHPTIQPLNFLTVDFNQFDKTALSGLWYDHVHIISYPPDDMAPAFIKKCCEFADSISFILPLGLEEHFTKEYRKVFSREMSIHDKNKPINKSTVKVFQIWQRDSALIF
jgi:hypothetical protein